MRNLKNDSVENTLLFRKLIDRLHFILKCNDINVEGYNSQALTTFENFDFVSQEKVLSDLHQYILICEKAIDNNIHLRSSKKFLKHCLNEFGVKAPESVYDRINDDEIIEAYNMEEIQVFRSVAFMDLCNYTVADVLLFEWYKLYDRPESVNQAISKSIETAILSTNDIVMCDIPVHCMTEKFASPKGTFECNFQFFSPLYSGPERKSGFLCVIRAQEVALEHHFEPILPAPHKYLKLLS